MTPKEKARLFVGIVNEAGTIKGLRLKVLAEIYLSDEALLIHALSKNCKVTAPAVSRALDDLESPGFIKRRRDNKHDQREVYVHLTAKGKALAEKIFS